MPYSFWTLSWLWIRTCIWCTWLARGSMRLRAQRFRYLIAKVGSFPIFRSFIDTYTELKQSTNIQFNIWGLRPNEALLGLNRLTLSNAIMQFDDQWWLLRIRGWQTRSNQGFFTWAFPKLPPWEVNIETVIILHDMPSIF